MKPAVITKSANNQPKSKTYLKYEKLLLTIEKQRQFNQNLKEGLEKAYQKLETELSPLQKKKNLHFRDYLIRLDKLASEIGLGKYNREWFDAYMTDELAACIAFFGHQDEKLAELYQKYNIEGDEDSLEDEENIMLAQSISQMLGVEVDPQEIYELGEEAFFAKYHEKIKEMINARRTEQAESAEGKSKPNAKTSKAADEEKALLRDARAVYMRLIKKYHPDHELDPVLREQKTEIVKLVTRAYQEEDFFELLKLQITYLDDNETDAEKVADAMLKRYNKILQKQLEKLQAWVRDAHFSGGDLVDFIDKSGKFSGPKFSAQCKALQKEISMITFNLENSKKRPKGWFKDQLSGIKDLMQGRMVKDMFGDMFDY